MSNAQLYIIDVYIYRSHCNGCVKFESDDTKASYTKTELILNDDERRSKVRKPII